MLIRIFYSSSLKKIEGFYSGKKVPAWDIYILKVTDIITRPIQKWFFFGLL